MMFSFQMSAGDQGIGTEEEEEGDGFEMDGVGETTGRDTVILFKIKEYSGKYLGKDYDDVLIIIMVIIITGSDHKEREEEEASHCTSRQESWCQTKRTRRCQEE